MPAGLFLGGGNSPVMCGTRREGAGGMSLPCWSIAAAFAVTPGPFSQKYKNLQPLGLQVFSFWSRMNFRNIRRSAKRGAAFSGFCER